MGDRAWCQRVATFCQSRGVVFSKTIAAMAKTQSYRTARKLFQKGGAWEEVHRHLGFSLNEVQRARRSQPVASGLANGPGRHDRKKNAP